MICGECGMHLDEWRALPCGTCESGRTVHVCSGCREPHLLGHLPELRCHDCGQPFRAPYWDATEPRCTWCHNARMRERFRESLVALAREQGRRV